MCFLGPRTIVRLLLACEAIFKCRNSIFHKFGKTKSWNIKVARVTILLFSHKLILHKFGIKFIGMNLTSISSNVSYLKGVYTPPKMAKNIFFVKEETQMCITAGSERNSQTFLTSEKKWRLFNSSRWYSVSGTENVFKYSQFYSQLHFSIFYWPRTTI